MPTEPHFTKKNVISDKTMTDAFRQGVEEGVAIVQSGGQTVFWVRIEFEGTQLNAREFEELPLALAFVEQNLHNGPGTTIEVQVILKGDTTPPAREVEAVAEDDDIEDAELVEE